MPPTDSVRAPAPRINALMRRRRRVRWAAAAVGLALMAGLVMVVRDEVVHSPRQAAWFSAQARQQTFAVEPGPSPAIRFPGNGPFDLRLGYHDLPVMLDRLQSQGYAVTAQVRMSPDMLSWHDRGLFVPYREKARGGLTLLDCSGEVLHAARHPARIYEHFDEVPPAVVAALLFIEDRGLLDGSPLHNPAVQWGRFGKAAFDHLLRRVDPAHAAGGGSTLATQIEKFRHSPGGRTHSAPDKLRQMASASLRAYLDGERTLPRRRQIVLDYLNTVPLSAQSGFGEVLGLGDALWAWYGRDFAEVNRLLSAPGDGASPAHALAFKQLLSLLVAQRRPSHYLTPAGVPGLRELTDSHLRLLAAGGVIAPALRDAALPLPLALAGPSGAAPPAPDSFIDRKAATALRGHLQALLGVPHAYDLDRLDLAVETYLSDALQQSATALLRSLGGADAAVAAQAARAAGLYGRHLLSEGDDLRHIAFSFTLFERAGDVNLLRVQTDSVDQPFDLNAGARLDLGSTAKLRTLVTYLEQVASLHERWQMLDRAQLAALEIGRRDAIARWARDHLAAATDRSLATMLEAAMQRSYSASPGERFFTGSGVHRFGNFDATDDARTMTVGEAFRRSVNLVFIRLMRDIVQRVLADGEGTDAALLDAADDPRRQAYLARFAEHEGRQFIARFHRQYAGRPAQEVETLLMRNRRLTPVRLASLYYGLEPAADAAGLESFLGRWLPGAQPSAGALHDRYRDGQWSLADRGYLAGVHPLALWVAGHLRQNPDATLAETLAASGAERQAVYGWLFKTRRKAAQDQRIRGLLEQDAFVEIHRAWQRLGYPFESLTPSYATALGASGDRPAALAELMGILVNGGMRLPTARVASLQFAADTPYETRLAHQPGAGERVLPAEVAATVRRALVDVVENGTGRRLKGALALDSGAPVEMGGKTGTGDHRYDTHGRDGRRISSRVISRSATLVFMIGERHFGTLMAYAGEPAAAGYRFTSALPTQLLKALAPQLAPLVRDSACGHAPVIAAQR